jgi:hypothetical protein
MQYVRWVVVFAVVAALCACTPFVGPPKKDAGDASVTADGLDELAADGPGIADEVATDLGPSSDTHGEQESDTAPAVLDAAVDSGPEASSVEVSLDLGSTDGGSEGTCDGQPICKKEDGEVCSSDSECAKGVCGGRCCAAGCNCTQPNPMNLLENPGIDTDTSGWSITAGTGVLSRSLSDAERCPYSGSLTITLPAGGDGVEIGQCVSNVPIKGDINFGASVQIVGGDGEVVACQLVVYSGFNCDADEIGTNETAASKANLGWTQLGAALAMVTGGNSFTLSCGLLPDQSADTTFYLDMLYVSLGAAGF